MEGRVRRYRHLGSNASYHGHLIPWTFHSTVRIVPNSPATIAGYIVGCARERPLSLGNGSRPLRCTVGDGAYDRVLLFHLGCPVLQHRHVLLAQSAHVWVVEVLWGKRHLLAKKSKGKIWGLRKRKSTRGGCGVLICVRRVR